MPCQMTVADHENARAAAWEEGRAAERAHATRLAAYNHPTGISAGPPEPPVNPYRVVHRFAGAVKVSRADVHGPAEPRLTDLLCAALEEPPAPAGAAAQDRQLTVTVANPLDTYDVLTPEAVASMVGQTPRVLRGSDPCQPLGRATVTAASVDDNGDVRMTLDLDPRAYDALAPSIAVSPGEWSAGIGYQRHETHTHADPPTVPPVTLREVSPRPPAAAPAAPAAPAEHVPDTDAVLAGLLRRFLTDWLPSERWAHLTPDALTLDGCLDVTPAEHAAVAAILDDAHDADQIHEEPEEPDPHACVGSLDVSIEGRCLTANVGRRWVSVYLAADGTVRWK